MKTIFRWINGGLGDFLLLYTSTKSIAMDLGYEYYLYGYNDYINWNETKAAHKRDTTGWTDLFKEKDKFLNTIKLEHKNHLTFHLPYECNFKLTDFGVDFCEIAGFPFGNRYFEHNLKTIKESFNIPSNINYQFDSDEVVLNTRRKEWPGSSPEYIDLCFTNYYLLALKELKPKKVTLVSDDIDWTINWFNSTLKNNFPNVELNYYQDIPIKQFEFLIKSPKLIICQSSFSRFAGMLNKNLVCSPYKWYRTIDSDIYTCNLKNWNLINYV